MVKREIPQPVGWLQALLPIAIGMLSHPLTIPFSMGYLKALAADPNAVKPYLVRCMHVLQLQSDAG